MQLASGCMSGSWNPDVLKGDAASLRLMSPRLTLCSSHLCVSRDLGWRLSALCGDSDRFSDQSGLIPEASETRTSESCKQQKSLRPEIKGDWNGGLSTRFGVSACRILAQIPFGLATPVPFEGLFPSASAISTFGPIFPASRPPELGRAPGRAADRRKSASGRGSADDSAAGSGPGAASPKGYRTRPASVQSRSPSREDSR